MSIKTLQAQCKQLRAQLKASTNSQQSKMLAAAIQGLEAKLAEEKQKQAVKSPKIELVVHATPKKSKRVTPKKEAKSKQSKSNGHPPKEEIEASSNTPKTQANSPPKEQQIFNGRILKAAPGQGQHQFVWSVYGTVEEIAPKKYTFTIDDGKLTLPANAFYYRQKTLQKDIPLTAYCTVYPTTQDGEITGVTLGSWRRQEKQEELILAQGLWVPDEEKLVIQTDFQRWQKHAKNFYHHIPLIEGLEFPKKGFQGFWLKREGLKLFITEAREPHNVHKTTEYLRSLKTKLQLLAPSP